MNLDDALAAWAADIRLTETAAEDIYRRIVATPVSAPASAPASTPVSAPVSPPVSPRRTGGPGLDPAWWRAFTTEFTERMITVTKPVPWAA